MTENKTIEVKKTYTFGVNRLQPFPDSGVQYGFIPQEIDALKQEPELYVYDSIGNIAVIMVVFGYKSGQRIICLLNKLSYEGGYMKWLVLPAQLRKVIVSINPNILTQPVRAMPDEISYIFCNTLEDFSDIKNIKV